jgi:hypothetical protein
MGQLIRILCPSPILWFRLKNPGFRDDETDTVTLRGGLAGPERGIECRFREINHRLLPQQQLVSTKCRRAYGPFSADQIPDQG